MPLLLTRPKVWFFLFSQLRVWSVFFSASACSEVTPGDSEGVYVLETDRQTAFKPSLQPASLYDCHLLGAGEQLGPLPSVWLDSSGLFGLCLLASNLNLFPLWGLFVHRDLLNCRNRTITACEDVHPRWIRQKVLDNSQHIKDHPVQIGAQAVHVHTSARAHLGQRVMLGEKGEPLTYMMGALFSLVAGDLRPVLHNTFSPPHLYLNSSVNTLNVPFWGEVLNLFFRPLWLPTHLPQK